jgi:thymidylate synthase (FAD)
MTGERVQIHEHGFIELIDVMGDDEAIVRAAAVSYGKDATSKTPEEQRTLIRYLMRHWHTTPFEMVEFKFHCQMTIREARQWIRHRTANVNEYSARYAKLPDLYHVPTPERIRAQSTSNKQGSGADVLEDAEYHSQCFDSEAAAAFKEYNARCDIGMAKELARSNLPLSTYTRWYWKCDLHNIFNFLRLRMDSHAQEEIRLYANAMAEMVKARCPVAYEAFEDYRLHAVTFSRQEMEVILAALDGTYVKAPRGHGKREAEEFLAKLVAR